MFLKVIQISMRADIRLLYQVRYQVCLPSSPQSTLHQALSYDSYDSYNSYDSYDSYDSHDSYESYDSYDSYDSYVFLLF